LNPRRPTPSGPEPERSSRSTLIESSVDEHGFPSHSPAHEGLISGNSHDALPSEEQLKAFFEWCVERGTSARTCEQYVRYLRKPLDPNNKWSRLAYKAWFKFVGDEERWKQLKVKRSGVDLYIPSDEGVKQALQKACKSSNELCWVYKLLIYSGLRLEEVTKVISEQNPERWILVSRTSSVEVWKYPLAWRRGSKQAFYCYALERPPKMLVSAKWVSNWASKNSVLAPKYIRKWVATKMLSLGIPEEVVNFVQGRVPQEVLSKHYLKLSTLADQYYQRYAEWLRAFLGDGL